MDPVEPLIGSSENREVISTLILRRTREPLSGFTLESPVESRKKEKKKGNHFFATSGSRELLCGALYNMVLKPL
jgi:hypothetical protein